MCGDNDPGGDLERASIIDLYEMEISNNEIAVHVVYDGRQFGYDPNITSDSYLILDENGIFKVVDTIDEINTGYGGNLSLVLGGSSSSNHYYIFGSKSFLGALYYPANHFALILWDHGGAWLGDSRDQWRSVINDYTSNDQIRTPELRQAISEALSRAGRSKLDLLGFDACLMGSLEVLYELRNVASYVVASSFSEPGYGWCYEFLSGVDENTSSLELGQLIVNYFKNYAQDPDHSYSYWLTEGLSLAVYDMSKIELLANYVSELAYYLILNMDDPMRNRILYDYYPYFTIYYYLNPKLAEYPTLADLYDIATFLYSYEANSNIVNSAYNVLYYLPCAVPYYYVEKENHVIYYPMSIFMPNESDVLYEFASDYNTLSFTSTYWWSNFLETLLQTGDILLAPN